MKPVDLLWTSGWDSTYRLLDLVIRQRLEVQPWYVTDRERPSSAMELAAQDDIRAALANRDPEAAALILPAKVVDRHDLAEDAEVAEAFQRLKQRSYIGYQYDFLAKLARSRGLNELELSVHQDDRLVKHLEGHVEQVDGNCQVTADAPPELEHMRYFRFPLLTMTKVEMQRQAEQGGFLDLMQMTWFCHYPKGGQPCGSCNPCRTTVAEGLGARVPWKRRLRAALITPMRPLLRMIRERRERRLH